MQTKRNLLLPTVVRIPISAFSCQHFKVSTSAPVMVAERVIAASAAIPEEYWFPAVPRPRRVNPWNTLSNSRHQLADTT